MSDTMKVNLTRWGAIVALLAGLSGLFAAWGILPHRMDAAEAEIKDVKRQSATDHDLIQRIDERTARMEKQLDRLAK